MKKNPLHIVHIVEKPTLDPKIFKHLTFIQKWRREGKTDLHESCNSLNLKKNEAALARTVFMLKEWCIKLRLGN